MNLESFCYIGLARFPEQLEPCLALLPDEQKAEAARILATVKDLPKKELLQRWSKLREEEGATLRRKAGEVAGIRLDEISPSLRDWCVSWLADQDG
ncbi:MAG TPA: hypothetical protein VMT05_00810 [Terriglobales bacterium]|nr:hypothetical protein [Terriglobales bacterium]